ncbi:hypothetical protein BKA80DRAFT_268030 [Phyllosticta citrichinensis]
MDARSLVLVCSGEVLVGLGSRSPRHSSALSHAHVHGDRGKSPPLHVRRRSRCV